MITILIILWSGLKNNKILIAQEGFHMRRIVSWVIVAILLFGVFPAANSYSANEKPLTVSEVLALINKDMKELYGMEDEYFKSSVINKELGESLPLRNDLINHRLEQGKDGKGKYNFEIVYGSDHGKTLTHKEKEMKEYSGYSRDGYAVPTEGVPWYSGWSGKQIQDFDLIKTPWSDPEVKDKFKIKKNVYSGYENLKNKYLKDGTFEQSIIDGLNNNYANQKYGPNFMYQDKNNEFADKEVYKENAVPSKGGRWVDYVHVIQPPTEIAWGFGTVYINHKNGNITYLDIPIAPFNLNYSPDIAASFDTLPPSAVQGDVVKVGVLVTSTFLEDVDSSFEWSLTDKDGKPLDSSDNLKFEGDSKFKSGKITIPSKDKRVLYASFKMPDSNVQVTFNVNKDGKNPKEADLSNNKLDSGSKAIAIIKPVSLGYDLLSKNEVHSLPSTVATLSLPSLPAAKWTGPATGQLNVTNNNPEFLRNFKVTDNPAVNEPSETITRKPTVHFTIRRQDFDPKEDPVRRKYLNDVDSLSRRGYVSYSGSVTRPYSYEEYYTTCTEGTKETEPVCTENTRVITGNSVTANFEQNVRPEGGVPFPYILKVYNGLDKLPKHKYEDKFEIDKDKPNETGLLWTNETYPFSVVRSMNHIAENGDIYKWTDTVPGQYKREFTQQASGNVLWAKNSSMSSQYAQARAAAKQNKSNKSQMDTAVFATDRELQSYNYPIKSGYYFNPAGSYDLTVKTVMYKNTDADTDDHKELVKDLVDSFRYESDIMYINAKKVAVNVSNEPLAAKGGGYDRKKGTVKVQNPKGVNAINMISVKDRSTDESRYSKTADLIPYGGRTGESHEYWKKVLEGYGESFTAGSYTGKKYREYVKPGQTIYRITETTKVTIVVNPLKARLYTHANMPNGKYNIRVWIDKTELSKKYAYKSLDTIRGIQVLDSIPVTVVGSIFDDLNN